MTIWILDKSAHVRLLAGATPTGIDLTDLAICDMGELEWLYSARSATHYETQRESLRRAYPILPAPTDIFDRVRRLQRDLAHHRGMWHRTPLLDLFIAETALHHQVGVLHHDGDYSRIARVRPGFQTREFASSH
jgi:predicted nucleic acid-binding protein